jgi:hypothetical protein
MYCSRLPHMEAIELVYDLLVHQPQRIEPVLCAGAQGIVIGLVVVAGFKVLPVVLEAARNGLRHRFRRAAIRHCDRFDASIYLDDI